MPNRSLQTEIKKRKPFQSAAEEAYLNLRRTHSMLGGPFDALFKEHGTTEPQYNVLRILRGAKSGGENALPSLEIADRMITRVPDITRLVDRLEQGGLVERRRTRDDRRVVLVSITKTGLDLLTKLDRPGDDLIDTMLGHLSKSELADLNRLLVKARCRD
jgi:DNA-binding MarR family transcriptional regulator